MSLYDWVSRSERKKLPAKKNKRKRQSEIERGEESGTESCSSSDALSDPSGAPSHGRKAPRYKCFQFLADHPLSATHGTYICPKEKERIPNFVGATLPRFDQGDWEYYCSTMLTLFKPWRSGLDLKTADQSWDDAFSAYEFSERHKTVMKNANIRYECLDARDDFHAQLRKGGGAMAGFNDIDMDVIEEIQQGGSAGIVNAGYELAFDPDEIVIKGKREKARNTLMKSARHTMQGVGWTESAPDLLPNDLDVDPHRPEVFQSSAAWKSAVAQKRAEVLELQSRYMPEVSSKMEQSGASHFVPNEVRVVDKSYLTRKHVSKEWEATVKTICHSFELNNEQERAFRIVANHACSPDSEQLNMYIGGMAGTGKSQVLKALIRFFAERKESHRLMVLAPTGSAAALLGGSTYHSVLGINSDGGQTSNVQLAQVKSRLEGVQYIFIDEVSMLSCRDMYLISARLARVMNNLDTPFGGMNMMFAGDFAQLPPVIGQQNAALYS
jgi:hypothetical protein